MSQYYVLKGRSHVSYDSPWPEDDVLWNPGQYKSLAYMAYVQVLERELSIESGLVDMQIDEIEVDPDRLETFARRLLEELAQTSDEVNAAQIRPVRYGTGAVLTVGPYMPDSSGEILRWVLQMDGEEVDTADIRIDERDGRSVMLLTDGTDEIELARWREGARGSQGAPASIVDTLGALQRRVSGD